MAGPLQMRKVAISLFSAPPPFIMNPEIGLSTIENTGHVSNQAGAGRTSRTTHSSRSRVASRSNSAVETISSDLSSAKPTVSTSRCSASARSRSRNKSAICG